MQATLAKPRFHEPETIAFTGRSRCQNGAEDFIEIGKVEGIRYRDDPNHHGAYVAENSSQNESVKGCFGNHAFSLSPKTQTPGFLLHSMMKPNLTCSNQAIRHSARVAGASPRTKSGLIANSSAETPSRQTS